MTVTSAIGVFRIAFVAFVVGTLLLFARGHGLDYLPHLTSIQLLFLGVSLLIRCPACGSRLSTHPEFWLRVTMMRRCQRCATQLDGISRPPVQVGAAGGPSRSSQFVRKRPGCGSSRPRALSTRALAFTMVFAVLGLFIGTALLLAFMLLSPTALVVMLAAISLMVLSFPFVVRCRRCGASPFLRSRWLGATWPAKRCYRCGQDFSNDR